MPLEARSGGCACIDSLLAPRGGGTRARNYFRPRRRQARPAHLAASGGGFRALPDIGAVREQTCPRHGRGGPAVAFSGNFMSSPKRPEPGARSTAIDVQKDAHTPQEVPVVPAEDDEAPGSTAVVRVEGAQPSSARSE